tara:strand:- start:29 stop:361 length:333 start_codon:yes stop_codon:yes gene_type:complete
MGSTLEAQKAKAPKPKKQTETVSPGKPFYSSKAVQRGFEATLPSAVEAERSRQLPTGMMSPTAAILKTGIRVGRMMEPDEVDVGSRLAEKAAKETIKRNDGGIARKTRVF